ncbi:MAG TPA: T9SS type A sorting domain-containing protein, partial [Patescibacteria group bacterium]|nr:T9SS type A sorting domain-containing protein [Patescibacteria group bacterium]
GSVSAIVSPDTSVCPGGSIVLLAAGGGTYEWSPSEGLNTTSGNSVVCTPVEPMRYRVIVSGGDDCKDTAYVFVDIRMPPLNAAGEDIMLCRGDSVVIGAEAYAGLQCRWTPDTGLSDPNVIRTKASPSETTTYYLMIPDQGSICSALDSMTITVTEPPQFTIRDTALCEGGVAELFLEILDDTGAGNYRYQWNPSFGLSDPNIARPVVTASIDISEYNVTVTNEAGCSTTKTVRVNALPGEKIKVSLTTPKKAIDPGESIKALVTIQAENTPDGIRSITLAIEHDEKIFKITPDNPVFKTSVDASWWIAGRYEAPGRYLVKAWGDTPLTEAVAELELTGYLAEKDSDSLSLTILDVSETPPDSQFCRVLMSSGIPLSVNEVCGGNLRLVNIGSFQTALYGAGPVVETGGYATVRYSLGLGGFAMLGLYNVHGVLLKTVAQGEMKAGEYEASIYSGDIASGTYFLKMTTGQITITRLVTFVR